MQNSKEVGIPLYDASNPAGGGIPIQARIEKIELYSSADAWAVPYDITESVTELELTESIHSISVIGSISILDNFNFFQDARIHGQEKIKIKIRRTSVSDASYGSVIEKEFYTTNLRDYVRSDSKTHFTLEFASPHAFLDKTVRINRAYGYVDLQNIPKDGARSDEAYQEWKNKYEKVTVQYGDIFEKTNESAPAGAAGMAMTEEIMVYPELFIYHILKNDLKIKDDDLWLYGYHPAAGGGGSAKKMKLIVPNWRPFQAIRWILRNTYTDMGNNIGHPWFCYETVVAGIRIEPYSILVKKVNYGSESTTASNEMYATGRTTKEIPEAYIYNSFFSADAESPDYYQQLHKKIHEIEMGFSFNTFERAGGGSYSSLQQYVDVATKYRIPNDVITIDKTQMPYEGNIIPGTHTIGSHFKPYSSATLDNLELDKTNFTYFIAYNSTLHGTYDDTYPYNEPFYCEKPEGGTGIGAGGIGSSVPRSGGGSGGGGTMTSDGPVTTPGGDAYATSDGKTFDPKVEDAIKKAAEKHGVSEEYMMAMASIESTGNPTAVSKTGAKGLYQFTGPTGEQYGLNGPGFDNRFDPYANADAAARYANDNRKALEGYGVSNPTDFDLYMAHQQGAFGWSKIKSGNITPAIRGNMDVNLGRGQSPQEFATSWESRYKSKVTATGYDYVGGRVT